MAFSFSNLFAKQVRSVIGVDIGTSSIKVVQMRRDRGRAVLETYGAIALGPYAGVEIGRATQLPTEKITAALRDVIREANVTSAEAGIAIPYSSSLISIVELPAAAESRLDQTMPLEARKYIPVPINEVKLDWTLVSGNKGSSSPVKKIQVMLVAIHNETLEKYRNIGVGAALQAAFFEIEVFSAVRASLDHGIAPVAVVDVGAATTKFYVVERGLVRESHIINRGSQEWTLNASRALNISVMQAEERKRKEGLRDWAALSSFPPPGAPPMHPALPPDMFSQSLELSLAPLMAEISRTLASFEQRMQEAISTIVFSGGGASLNGFSAYAQSKLQAEVHIADPFSKLETPAFLQGTLREAGPEFTVAVGLALRRLQEIG